MCFNVSRKVNVKKLTLNYWLQLTYSESRPSVIIVATEPCKGREYYCITIQGKRYVRQQTQCDYCGHRAW